LNEAYFDLDLDAYFNEANLVFKQLHPDKDLLLRPEDTMKNYEEEYSDEEAKVIEHLMGEF
jgi:hypothetical protein